jgi:hypothetical protein
LERREQRRRHPAFHLAEAHQGFEHQHQRLEFMTREQIEALIEYIDAAIEYKTDDGNSSDGGLISSMQKTRAKEKLVELLIEEE